MTDLVRQSPSQQHQVVAGRRRWWRWAAAIAATILVLGVVGVFVALKVFIGPTPAALALPPSSAAGAGTSSSSIDGTWTVGSGSLAGYRVGEDFLWQHGSVVGRTSVVTGTVVIANTQVSSASFRVDLTTVKANGKTQPQFAGILDTRSYPTATFTLTTPIVASTMPTIDKTFTATATGLLAMHGVTRPVTFELTARYSGSVLEEAGSIPVVFSNWNIKGPGWPLQSHGVVEFLLVMHR
jgi:polyisoprenoid-binding protein YceI